MATVAAAIDSVASKKVDASLWWDSFTDLFDQLDRLGANDQLPAVAPSEGEGSLTEKLRASHSWLLHSVAQFKCPNPTSRAALDLPNVDVGKHRLKVKEPLKRVSLEASSQLNLDEVQAYILVSRAFESVEIEINPGRVDPAILQNVATQFYLERQSLLRCIRTLLTLHEAEEGDVPGWADAVQQEVQQLIGEGLLTNTLSLVREHLGKAPPSHLSRPAMDLCAEELSLELVLLLDILFMLFYETDCSAAQFQSLLELFKVHVFGANGEMPSVSRLALTQEAARTVEQAKHRAALLLVEALDLDKVLLMVQQQQPIGSGGHAFAMGDVLKLDAVMELLDPLEAPDCAPLLLAWAVFTGLWASLATALDLKGEAFPDHSRYAQLAYRGGAYAYLDGVLSSEAFQEEEAQVGGYKSVVKTLIAGLLAAYDIVGQGDSEGFLLVVTILCRIYEGQEVLCLELWDRDSPLDGPIRSLLYTLRDHFPYRVVPLLRLLGAVCEGQWPTECVYDFLYRKVRVTTLYQYERPPLMSGRSPLGREPAEEAILRTPTELQVPGASGLLIPAGTLGRVLRMVEGNVALVRWDCEHSAILVLLLRAVGRATSSGPGSGANQEVWEEVRAVLELLDRILAGNRLLADLLLNLDDAAATRSARSDGRMDPNLRIDVISMLSALVHALGQHSAPSVAMLAACVRILAALARCYPRRVAQGLSDTCLLQPYPSRSLPRGESLAGTLLHALLNNREQLEGRYPLTLAMLSLTGALLERGLNSETAGVAGLVHYAVFEVLANHATWRYRRRGERWEVATKALQVIRAAATSPRWPLVSPAGREGPVEMETEEGMPRGDVRTAVEGALLTDPSLHGALLRVLAVDARALEELRYTRAVKASEVDGLLQALGEALGLLTHLLEANDRTPAGDEPAAPSSLEEALFRGMVGTTLPHVTAVGTLVTYSRAPALQEAAVRALAALCGAAQRAQPRPLSLAGFFSAAQVDSELRAALGEILSESSAMSTPSLFKAGIELLATAIEHQPSLVELFLFPRAAPTTPLAAPRPPGAKARLPRAAAARSAQGVPAGGSVPTGTEGQASSPCLDALWDHVRHSAVHLASRPETLSRVLHLFLALWDSGTPYFQLLHNIRSRPQFWTLLTTPLFAALPDPSPSTPSSHRVGPEERAELGSPFAGSFQDGSQRKAQTTSAAGSKQQILELAFRFRCEASVLRIMASDIFLQQNLVAAPNAGGQEGGAAGVGGTANAGGGKGMGGGLGLNPEPSQGEKGEAGVGARGVAGEEGGARESGAWEVMREWRKLAGKEPSAALQRYAASVYDAATVQHTKAEARVLLVGLMAKAVAGEVRGLNFSLAARMQQAATELLQHPAMRELLNQYSSHSYSRASQVQLLVLSDLYHHLEGELQGGRPVPPGPFRQIADFLSASSSESILLPETPSPPSGPGHHPAYGDSYVVPTGALGEGLGVEWWRERKDEGLEREATEHALRGMRRANAVEALGDGQLAALEAWAAVVVVSAFDSQGLVRTGARSLPDTWTLPAIDSCLVALSQAHLETVTETPPSPGRQPTDHLGSVAAAQARLLLALTRWWAGLVGPPVDASISALGLPAGPNRREGSDLAQGSSGFGQKARGGVGGGVFGGGGTQGREGVPASGAGGGGGGAALPSWALCLRLVQTSLGCLRRNLTGQGLVDPASRGTAVPLLGVLLVTGELMRAHSSVPQPGREGGRGGGAGGEETAFGEAFAESALALLGFLPILCKTAVLEPYADLAIAAVDLAIKGYLATPAWTQILATNLPLPQVLGRLRGEIAEESGRALLGLALTLSQSQAGAHLLFSSDLLRALAQFCQELAEAGVSGLVSSGAGSSGAGSSLDGASRHGMGVPPWRGPFCLSWEAPLRPAKGGLWGAALGLTASMVRTLGGTQLGEAVVEQALAVLALQRPHILAALRPPPPPWEREGRESEQAAQDSALGQGLILGSPTGGGTIWGGGQAGGGGGAGGKLTGGGLRPRNSQQIFTGLEALMEGRHVALLLCETARFSSRWTSSHGLSSAASAFSDASARLLAYIAREGMGAGAGSGDGTAVNCCPENREERELYRLPGFVGSQRGWFAVTARGSVRKKLSALPKSREDPGTASPALAASGGGASGQGAASGGTSNGESQGPPPSGRGSSWGEGRGGREALSFSAFSDGVALSVYSLALALLHFHCTLATGALPPGMDAEGGAHYKLPALPAPEVLHGLQDQAFAILQDVCGGGLSRASSEPRVQSVCMLLLGLLERAVFVEALLGRAYCMLPGPLRGDHFGKAMRALRAAAESHPFLVEPLEAIQSMASMLFSGQ